MTAYAADTAWGFEQGAQWQHEQDQEQIAALQAVIDAAPHDALCSTRWPGPYPLNLVRRCDCWKSAAPSDVLAAKLAEVRAKAVEETPERIKALALAIVDTVPRPGEPMTDQPRRMARAALAVLRAEVKP
jgi:hypothetical protein